MNSDYRPLCTVSWQRAMTLYYLKKATIVKKSDMVIHDTNHNEYIVPSVMILLNTYIKFFKTKVKLKKCNIFCRDLYTCQYCLQKFIPSKLTVDHVIPKSKGGKTIWENLTTSCRKCNSKKGQKIIQPASRPYEPKNPNMFILSEIPDEWLEFIYS